MIHRLRLAGAPDGLQIAVMESGDGARRGLSGREVDQLLAALLPDQPPDQPVVRLAGGQPVARGRDDLHLSLSHALGATALAVAPFPLGIDIEGVDPDLDASEIASELFGANDLAYLNAQPAAVRPEHFTRLWTLKEARLKRYGLTLAEAALPEIVAHDGRIGAGMATRLLTLGVRRYCVGVSWEGGVAPFECLASENCL
jgi:hypothetical protein